MEWVHFPASENIFEHWVYAEGGLAYGGISNQTPHIPSQPFVAYRFRDPLPLSNLNSRRRELDHWRFATFTDARVYVENIVHRNAVAGWVEEGGYHGHPVYYYKDPSKSDINRWAVFHSGDARDGWLYNIWSDSPRRGWGRDITGFATAEEAKAACEVAMGIKPELAGLPKDKLRRLFIMMSA